MKIDLAIIISFLVLLLGLSFNKPYLWIPLSVLVAGFIDLFIRQWVISDRLGSATNLSILIKFFLTLIMFYAMIGQMVCIGLVLWWFVF